MNKVSLKVRGKYAITVRDIRTQELVKEKCLEVSNTVTYEGRHWLISNSGTNYNYYMTGKRYSMNPSIQFGTGTSAITESDTTLGGTVITKGTGYIPTVATRATDLLTLETKVRAVFSPGQATGTFGQVGLFYNNLLAGQQIKDEQGNPVTVTFLETEEVTVEYSLFHTWPCAANLNGIGDQPVVATSPVTVNGQSHTIKHRGFGVLLQSTNTLALDDSTTMVYPPWNKYDYNSNMMGYVVWLSDTIDGSYTSSAVDGTIRCSPLETITKGVTYRQRGFVDIPYTAFQNKYLKYMMFAGSRGTTTGFPSVRSGGYVEFDPPIFKGQGDEMSIEHYIEYEIS